MEETFRKQFLFMGCNVTKETSPSGERESSLYFDNQMVSGRISYTGTNTERNSYF